MSNESLQPTSPAPAATPQPPVVPPTATSTSADPHLFDRLSVLYKYRWATIAVFALVVGWVMIDSYTKIPVYRAVARILIEDPSNDLATPTEISRSVTMSDPDMYLQTQLRIMRGRDLAQRVAGKLDLTKVPEFNGQGPKPTQLAIGIAMVKYYAAWPYRLITSSQVDAPTSVETVSASGYPEALIARMKVVQVRGSQLVDITFDSADPEFATRAVNTFAEEYVQHNLSLKVENIEKSAEWLTGEVAKQAELMRQSDLRLAEYKESQDATSLDSNQNIIVANLTASNDAATKARLDRIAKEGLWRQIDAANQTNDVESISSVIGNAQIQNLRNQVNLAQQEAARLADRYGERHPDRLQAQTTLDNTQRQLQDEIRKALPLAGELGIKIAFENVWNMMLLSPLEMARYIDEFESPLVGAYFDVGNIVNYGWPEHWIRTLGKRIMKLDIKEYSRKMRDQSGPFAGFKAELGEGDCDWPAVLKALDEIGYTGWGTAEVAGGDRERLAEISRRMDKILH